MLNPESSVKITAYTTKVLVVGVGASDRALVFKVDAPVRKNGNVKLNRKGEGDININIGSLLRGKRGKLRFYIINSGLEDRRFDNNLF